MSKRGKKIVAIAEKKTVDKAFLVVFAPQPFTNPLHDREPLPFRRKIGTVEITAKRDIPFSAQRKIPVEMPTQAVEILFSQVRSAEVEADQPPAFYQGAELFVGLFPISMNAGSGM